MARTVLIIDDVGSDRIILSTLFRQVRYDVIDEAKNGTEGIKKAFELQPNIITLDIITTYIDRLQLTEYMTHNN